jgi:hypothetical protein
MTDHPEVRALVVGIEVYAGGTDWGLRGPANDACEFSDWLLRNGASAANISAYINSDDPDSLEQWSARTGVNVRAPVLPEIYAGIVDGLRTSRSELLFVFWGGHGFTDPEDRFRLLTGDATDQVVHNVDLDNVLLALRSSNFRNFRRQVIIVDACRRFMSPSQLTAGLPSMVVPVGELGESEQFSLFATREGELAKNLGSDRSGQFSQVLLSELAAGETWPPDMDRVAADVRARFKLLRDDDHAIQTPVFVSKRGYDGAITSEQLAPWTKVGAPEGISEGAYLHRMAGRLETRLAHELRLSGMGPSFEVLRSPSLVTRAYVKDMSINALHVTLSDAAEYVGQHRTDRMVITGQPGAGKSVLINLMALRLCRHYRAGESAVPIMVTEHGECIRGDIDVEWLIRSKAPALENKSLGELLHRCTFFFDAFDELDENLQTRILKFMRAHHTMSAVLSTRSLHQIDWSVLPNCEVLELLPIDIPQIQHYLELEFGPMAADEIFCELVGPGFIPLREAWRQAGGTDETFWSESEPVPRSLAGEAAARRRMLLREPPVAIELARSPFILTALARIHRAGERVDVTRPAIIGRLIALLWEKAQSEAPVAGIALENLIRSIGKLAVQMLRLRQEEFSIDAAELAMAAESEAPPAEIIQAGLRAGLLEGSKTSVFFRHSIIRDYLAAATLATQIPDFEQAASFTDPQAWWRATPWNAVFPFVPSFHGNFEVLVNWLGPAQPELTAVCLQEDLGEISKSPARQRLRQLIRERLNDYRIDDPTELAALGRALGLVGDDRPGVGVRLVVSRNLPEIDWVLVPAQTLRSSEGQEIQSRQLYISRYPVSNAQYQSFVDAGGYSNDSYWSALGRAHRDRLNWTAPEQYGFPFGLPNHPVVGVSYHEAIAFCGWLTESTGQRVTLPTSTEWMAAARSAQGLEGYPWGSDFSVMKCNSRQSNIRATTAVGIFSGGASHYGLLDCGGNVWELCQPVLSQRRGLKRYRFRSAAEPVPISPIKGGSFAHYWCSVETRTDVYAKDIDREWDVGFRPIRLT